MSSFRDIGTQTFWRIFLFGLFVYVVFSAQLALGILLISVVLSLGLSPLVNFFEKHKINRLFSTVSIFLIGGSVLAGLLYLIIPIVVTETVGFLGDFNYALFSLFGVGLPTSFIKDISTNLSQLVTFLGTNNFSVGGAVSQIVSKIIFLLSTLAVSFYLTVEKRGTEHLLRVILPRAYEGPALKVYERFRRKVSRWLGTQLVERPHVRRQRHQVLLVIGLLIVAVAFLLVCQILLGMYQLHLVGMVT